MQLVYQQTPGFQSALPLPPPRQPIQSHEARIATPLGRAPTNNRCLASPTAPPLHRGSRSRQPLRIAASVMYSMPQPAPSVNGGVVGSGANDGLGTINPSALNAPGELLAFLPSVLLSAITMSPNDLASQLAPSSPTNCLLTSNICADSHDSTVPHTPGSNVGSQSSPRGLKRSRSPEVHYEPDRNEDGMTDGSTPVFIATVADNVVPLR